MNAIKINTQGDILQLAVFPNETIDRNCFVRTPDSEVKFLSDADAALLSIIT